MVDWRTLKKGDRLVMRIVELGTRVVVPCSVYEIFSDHVILRAEGDYNLWLDDDFADMFYRRL